MIKSILLDVDGTLVLSNHAHAEAWVDAFAMHGYTVDFDTVLGLIGMGGDKLIQRLQPELSEDQGDGKLIKEARQKIFLEQYARDLQSAPGARQLVQELQDRGLQCIVASSAKQDELDVLLKSARVDDLLSEATTSDDAEHSKPDPDIVHVALERIGAEPSETIMIGDTPYDIQAARQAGVKCIALRCGGWNDDGLKEAVAIYDNPADLLAHLDDVLKS